MSVFTDERGKPNIKLLGAIAIVLMFVIVFVLPVLNREKTEEQEVFDVKTGIPEKNFRVELEKDEEIKYIEQKELQVFMNRQFKELEAEIYNTLRDEFDMKERDLINNIREEVAGTSNRLEGLIADLTNNENQYVESQLNSFTDDLKFIRDEIKYLKSKINYFEKKIGEQPTAVNKLIPTSTYTKTTTSIPPNNYQNTNSDINSDINIREEKPPFFLNGLIDGANRVAVLKQKDSGKDYSFREGDYFMGYTIIKINKNNIVVAKDSQEHVLPLQGGG